MAPTLTGRQGGGRARQARGQSGVHGGEQGEGKQARGMMARGYLEVHTFSESELLDYNFTLCA